MIIISGPALRAIGEACSVARTLAPALIVVEDVDLIAEDRESWHSKGPLLFQLLNEMDGLGSEVDVTFLLTRTGPTCWRRLWPPGRAGSITRSSCQYPTLTRGAG